VFHMAAQRRLRNVQAFRSFAEIAFLGDGHKRGEMAEFGTFVHVCTNLICETRRAVACAVS
jgi:hypothetical protein